MKNFINFGILLETYIVAYVHSQIITSDNSNSSILTSNSSVTVRTSSTFERVVTDPNEMNSYLGVSIDYSYNETNNEKDDGIPSVAGCPKSIKGYPWVYHGSPQRCFLVGTRGPCPSGQLLFGNSTTGVGTCDCLCPEPVIRLRLLFANDNDNITEFLGLHEDGGPSNTKENEEFRFCHYKDTRDVNEAVFVKENGTCYFLETQSFCNDGEWLVENETGLGLICVPQCSSTSGPLSAFTFNHKTRNCESKSFKLKKAEPPSQPVSLAGSIGHRICEDQTVYSKLLNKCIPKSKAFLLRLQLD